MAASGKKPSKQSNAKAKAPTTTESIQDQAHHPGVTQQGTEPLSRGERRRQQFEQRRIDRKKAPARQKRDKLVLRVVGGVLAAAIIFGIGYGVFDWLSTRDDRRQPEGMITYSYSGGNHSTDAVAYTESPPVGGTHNPAWQTCQFYDGKIASENAVHSLEHGAVWITYRPDISEADKERLQSWANDRSYLLVSEFDDQESPFVFTAWNNQLPLDSLDDNRATQFMNYYIQGPQTPERGASCTGIDTMVG